MASSRVRSESRCSMEGSRAWWPGKCQGRALSSILPNRPGLTHPEVPARPGTFVREGGAGVHLGWSPVEGCSMVSTRLGVALRSRSAGSGYSRS
jgi:hypothetical protein